MSKPGSQNTSSRPKTIRHLLIFQVKLWLEGFKDVILMPLSLGAALLDLVFQRGMLYSVMKLGDRFEGWVDLYAAVEAGESKTENSGSRADSLDVLLNEAANGIEKRATNGRSTQRDRSQSNS